MDELSAMINQVMSDPDAMTQLRSVAESLGINPQQMARQPAQQPAYQPAYQPSQPAQNPGMPDLSALSALLGNLQGQQAPPPPPPPQSNVDLSALSGLLGGLGINRQPAQQSSPDLSGLQGILGGLMGNSQPQNPPAQNPQAPNISALTALLNNGSSPQQGPSGGAGGFGGLDMGMIMKLSQALSTVSSNRANIDLLLALKPRLKEERAKKVDDAIRVMQLVQFLPLIKESGLFGQMDSLLGGLTGGGGIGNILGNVGGGIGNVLGGLGLGGRR